MLLSYMMEHYFPCSISCNCITIYLHRNIFREKTSSFLYRCYYLIKDTFLSPSRNKYFDNGYEVLEIDYCPTITQCIFLQGEIFHEETYGPCCPIPVHSFQFLERTNIGLNVTYVFYRSSVIFIHLYL